LLQKCFKKYLFSLRLSQQMNAKGLCAMNGFVSVPERVSERLTEYDVDDSKWELVAE
jgi:hypothetical protein